MNHRDVKLTPLEELKVLIKFLYMELPWRYIICAILGIIAMFSGVRGRTGVDIFFCTAIGLIIGPSFGFFIFRIIPDMFGHFAPRVVERYNEYKSEAQKKALEKIDDRLLK